MAKFTVVRDIALLDKGVGESNRFVAIEGVQVDEYGSLSQQSLQAAKRALSNEAVRKGAVRINQSDCVDMSGGLEASDDMVLAFNGGDIIYTSLQSGFAFEKFMIETELLVPEIKLKPRSLFSKWFS